MQYVISADIKKMYNFNVTDEVLTEISMVMGRWMAKIIDKSFKSLELIDWFCKNILKIKKQYLYRFVKDKSRKGFFLLQLIKN